MRKKIFLGMFLVCLGMLLFCTVLFFFMQYQQSVSDTFESLRLEAAYAEAGLRLSGREYLTSLAEELDVVWLSPEGEVLYQEKSRLSVDDPEIRSSMESGYGSDIRRSPNGGQRMAYYARRLEDGTILRLARPSGAFTEALTFVSPILAVLLLVVIITGAVAYRVTDQVLRPIIQLDPDEPDEAVPYPELMPLMQRIREQRETISQEEQQRQQLRKEFSANVTHELRTPLTSISGFAELMQSGTVPPDKMQEFSGDIYRESQRLLTLVGDILRLSKLDEEAGLPEAEDTDLYVLAGDVVRSLELPAQQRNITVTLEGGSAPLHAAPAVVREMIYNLTDNAIKYNINGGSVAVIADVADGRPYFTVRDTGIGIPKEEQERVFERFYRVDKSHSKRVGGTGLGLSIVKHAAAYHHATVNLTSQPGKGTSITVTFPQQK